MYFKLVLISVFSVSFFISKGQDTVNVMFYNLLHFPNGTTFCGNTISVSERVDSLAVILSYAKPDIFGVCELQSSSGADDILNVALNINGVTKYEQANYTSVSGSLQTHLFFNTDKFQLLSQQQITMSSRDADYYELNYHPDNINKKLHVIVTHLKAGNFSSSEQTRGSQAQSIMSFINNNLSGKSVLVMGDFNFYGDFESGWQNFATNITDPLRDPVNEIGSWSQNSSFESTHSQSTRFNTVYDCGVTGGLDDRFDFILTTNGLISGTEGIRYVPGSYWAIGNDGNHFNDKITWQGNNSVPQDVLTALYYTSDHLPIEMKLEVDKALSVNELKVKRNSILSYSSGAWKVSSELKGQMVIYNFLGQVLAEYTSVEIYKLKIEAFLSKKGQYIVQYVDQEGFRRQKVLSFE